MRKTAAALLLHATVLKTLSRLAAAVLSTSLLIFNSNPAVVMDIRAAQV
jgi:hypothetical protein